jgi:hypothetical protein
MIERFDRNWEDLARHIGYGSEREMLRNMYVERNLSLAQIGARLGCTGHAVLRHLIKLNIDRRPKGGDNNIANQTRKLFRLDQRLILFGELKKTAKYAGVSTNLLWKYRRSM